MGINRIKLQAGSTEEMIKAQEAAAQDPALDRIRQQLFGEGYVQDIGEGKGIAQYYSGFGLPQSLKFTPPVEEVVPVADITQPVVDTGGGGGGNGGVTGITSTSPAQNMGEGAQNPLTQMITTPTGETMTVKQAMTQDPAYSLPGQSDPFLASGAAGGARLPATQATTTLPSGDVFATDDPLLTEKMDYTEQQDPAFWERARDKFIETGQDIGDTFKNLAGQGIDLTKMAGSAILNFVKPGLGLATQVLPNISSASGAQQDLVKDQFVDEGVVLDDLGRIVQVGDYDTPENVMAGYVPGQTGLQIGDVKVGGGTIQESIVDRLSTLEKTKNEKYGGSFYNEDGTPKINPDTGQPTTLGAREEALKENLNTVARAAGAVTLEEYDPIGKKAGETTYATDYFPELGQEDTPIDFPPEKKPDVVEDKIKAVDTIAGNTVFVNTKTGEVFSDETLAYESLDPMGTGAIPPGEIGGPGYVEPPTPDNILAGTDDAFDYFDDIDISQDAPGITGTPVTGIIGPAGIEPFASDFGEDVDIDQGFVDTTPTPKDTPSGPPPGGPHGGDGGPKNIDTGNVTTAKGPPSELPSSPEVYQDAIMRGQTGGGNNGGNNNSGKGIVCTMMNEFYGFGSFRNKIWLEHSKGLAPEYQKGYHKIFLPLVAYARKDGVTNKIVRKTLEHIAVHRTIDIRQEARGKVHLLGRIYRKILEPICYIVGKYAKR